MRPPREKQPSSTLPVRVSRPVAARSHRAASGSPGDTSLTSRSASHTVGYLGAVASLVLGSRLEATREVGERPSADHAF